MTTPGTPARRLVHQAGRLVLRVIRAERAAYGLLQTFATQILVLLLNIATGILTARLLGAAGRGAFAAITLWPQLLATIGAIGLPPALVYYARRNPGAIGQVIGAGVQIGLVLLAMIYAAGFAIVPTRLAAYDPSIRTVAELCVLFTVNHLFTILLRPVLLAERRYGAYNLTQYGPPLLYLIALLGLAAAGRVTPVTTALAILLTGVPFFLWMMVLVLVRDPPISWRRAARRFARPLLSYMTRATPAELILSAFAFADRLILVGLLTPVGLGLYTVAYSFSRVLGMIPNTIGAIILPEMSGMNQPAIEQLFGHAFRYALYLCAASAGILLLLRDPLIALAFGHGFVGASDIFAILVIEMTVSGLGEITAQTFLAMARPGIVSAAQALALSAAIALIFVLVPHYGPIGAAAAMLFGSLVRLAVLLGGMRSALRFRLPRLRLTSGDISYVLARFS